MKRPLQRPVKGAVKDAGTTTAPLPAGFGIALDRDTRALDPTTLWGGQPPRAMRLTVPGAAAWTELKGGSASSPHGTTLARRLTDAGLAHPRPAPLAGPADVTVVIPVRDRSAMLDRCLSALGGGNRVLVVDDGSTESAAVVAVVTAHGANLIRRESSAGPGVARNTGLAAVDSDLVAFLDSDCVPGLDWIEALAAHFADPLVGAVAPRIVALPSPSTAGRYGATRGSLDLGEREARVVPSTRVSYVPTAALLVRRSALRQVEPFDPALRYGEDVDLIWRLHAEGWRIRYDPSVRIEHQEPERWIPLLARRFRYGTSAAALGERHPDAIAPLVLQPLPALAVGALLAGRPLLAAAGFVASTITMRHAVRRAGLPVSGVLRTMLAANRETLLGLGRYGTQFAAPALAAGLVAPGGRHPWRRRVAVGALLLGPVARSWLTRPPQLDPVRFAAGHLLDDIAYGTGVYAGAVRARSARALLPRVAWRPLRRTRAAVSS